MRHGVWLVSSLTLLEAGGVHGNAVVTSRSTDGGLAWNAPVTNKLLIDAGYTYHPESWSSWPEPDLPWGTYARTDSLAGMMNVLKAPAVGAEPIVIRPVVVDARVMMPRALDSFSDSEGGDAVLALSGVVTSEGRVSNIEINDGLGGVAMASMDAKSLNTLVDAAAMADARYPPSTTGPRT